ncbi:MAG: glycosyltransferase family 39 protein [Gaiella sp.]
MREALARFDRLAVHSRRGRIVFGFALLVYAAESTVLPLVSGRDFGTYTRFYVQMFEWDSVLPMSMLYRTPVAPLVTGLPLDLGGGWLAQAVMALLFAAAVLAWSEIAARFDARAALAAGIVLALYPGYGILFHRLSSDSVFAAAFALWGWLLVRAIERPGVARFVLAGLAVALCALVRPGNQVLLAFVLVPALLRAPLGRRVVRASAYAGVAVAVLAGWAILNGVRYDDYAVARAGNAYVPFFRALVRDHIVQPDNGPASRELAAAVRERLLGEEPYRSYEVDLEKFFGQASDRMFEDTLNLADETRGWDSDYSLLREAGLEAVREHPGRYASGVLSDLWRELWHPLHISIEDVPSESVPASGSGGSPADPTPEPSGGELIPAARQGFYTTTPDRTVREVWTSATAHDLVFDRPGDRERYEQVLAEMAELHAELPPYAGSVEGTRWLSRSSKLFPPPALWLLAGLIAIAVRRPARSMVAIVPALGAAAVLVTSALGTYAIIELAVPVAPAFVLVGVACLLGPRSRLRSAEVATQRHTT